MPIVEIRLDEKNQSATSGVIVADSMTSNAKILNQPFISVRDSKALSAANAALVYLRTTGAVRLVIPSTWDDYQKASKELIAQGATITQRIPTDWYDPDLFKQFGVVRVNDTILMTPPPASSVQFKARMDVLGLDPQAIPADFEKYIRLASDLIKGAVMPSEDTASVKSALGEPLDFGGDATPVAAFLPKIPPTIIIIITDGLETWGAGRILGIPKIKQTDIPPLRNTEIDVLDGSIKARNIFEDFETLGRLLNLPWDTVRRLLQQYADQMFNKWPSMPKGAQWTGTKPVFASWTELCLTGEAQFFRKGFTSGSTCDEYGEPLPDAPVWGDMYMKGYAEQAPFPFPSTWRRVVGVWSPDITKPYPGPTPPFPILRYGPEFMPSIPEVIDPFFMPIAQRYANMIQPAYKDLPALAKAQNNLGRLEGGSNGYGPVNAPRVVDTNPVRVGPKTKDVKHVPKSVYAARALLGWTTEVIEFVQDLWAALPKNVRSFVPGTQLPGGRPQYVRRRLYPTPQQMAKDIYRYATQMDVTQALHNVAMDQIMDVVYGKQAAGIARASHKAGFTSSINLSRLALIP